MNNLWIRSQNKEQLVKVNKSLYITRDILEDDSTYFIENGNSILGIYVTKERAIEILDTIQKLLTPTIISKPIVKETTKPQSVSKTFEQIGNDFEIKELNTFVFEMPKE